MMKAKIGECPFAELATLGPWKAERCDVHDGTGRPMLSQGNPETFDFLIFGRPECACICLQLLRSIRVWQQEMAIKSV
jgi:hypothetical protein